LQVKKSLKLNNQLKLTLQYFWKRQLQEKTTMTMTMPSLKQLLMMMMMTTTTMPSLKLLPMTTTTMMMMLSSKKTLKPPATTMMMTMPSLKLPVMILTTMTTPFFKLLVKVVSAKNGATEKLQKDQTKEDLLAQSGQNAKAVAPATQCVNTMPKLPLQKDVPTCSENVEQNIITKEEFALDEMSNATKLGAAATVVDAADAAGAAAGIDVVDAGAAAGVDVVDAIAAVAAGDFKSSAELAPCATFLAS
jgi:hypothetical protein